ncbi:Uncharacterised protein [Salmonella enterica subsp. salamae]|nr:Uncharacterised protein [Salmonella enterica subsp. salamae serovar Greenside]VEA62772.1 Uncharacterised protein [Salmonella enterica subsp. salamae]
MRRDRGRCKKKIFIAYQDELQILILCEIFTFNRGENK